jgi:hypothetical protein
VFHVKKLDREVIVVVPGVSVLWQLGRRRGTGNLRLRHELMRCRETEITFHSDSSRRFGDYQSNHQVAIGVVDPGLGHEQSIVEGAKEQIDYDVLFLRRHARHFQCIAPLFESRANPLLPELAREFWVRLRRSNQVVQKVAT